jgi:hypothetical protein
MRVGCLSDRYSALVDERLGFDSVIVNLAVRAPAR